MHRLPAPDTKVSALISIASAVPGADRAAWRNEARGYIAVAGSGGSSRKSAERVGPEIVFKLEPGPAIDLAADVKISVKVFGRCAIAG